MSRRDQGLVVSVIGAVVLALALFAPWYGVGRDSSGASVSAWEAFSGIDIALFGCAFLGGGLAAVIARGAADRTMVPAIDALGIVACALVLSRIMVQPEPASSSRCGGVRSSHCWARSFSRLDCCWNAYAGDRQTGCRVEHRPRAHERTGDVGPDRKG